MTAPELYFHAKKIFECNNIESASFEAMCILEHVFGKKLSVLLLEKPTASEEQKNTVNNLAYRRICGYPLQYLLGKWEFFGLPFYVGEGVLIPRQDTETLVETVLKIKLPENPKILDLCSGSGCIGVSLALNIKNADVTAVEISDKAAEYIKKNAELNNTDLNIVKDDVLSEKTAEIFSGIDVIVCNPPYLTADDMKSLQKEVTFEPETALFGGKDGLDFYRNITKLWKDCLKSGGILAYEIGMGQEDAVMKILEENNFINIETTEDLAGIIRVVRGEKI
ncbi:MAG: peptide chain release factor N(5)-glutamine methyltransferase [Oscillospiraceae bacterium]